MNPRTAIPGTCRSGLCPRIFRATAVRGQSPLLQGRVASVCTHPSRLAPLLQEGTARPSRGASCQRGFSLIELVVVIVLLGIAAVALLQQFSQAAGSLARNEQIQTAAQLGQACAEHLLAVRRGQDYPTAIGTDCSSLPGLAGYTTSVAPQGSPAACPVGAVCEELRVTVAHGAETRAQLSLMLVDY